MPSSPPKRGTRIKAFIVYGRNLKAYNAMSDFLVCLGLDPLSWDEAAASTHKPSPTTLEIVQAGFREAQIAVVLFTPDEKAQLRQEYTKSPDEISPVFQPRPNVLFEAGMAFAVKPEVTVLVILGKQRLDRISDLGGINYVEFDNTGIARRALVERINTALTNAGCHLSLKERCIEDNRVASDFGVKPEDSKISLTELSIFGGIEVFQRGIDYLKSQPHHRVVIYAPTGVWEKADLKAEWFQTIAGCLAKEQKVSQPRADLSVNTTLWEFVGVYGLPPVERDAQGKLMNSQKLSHNLNYMEDLLLPFNGLRRATIYFLPDAQFIPGSGVIIIDDTLLAIGFATSNEYLVDYGFILANEREVSVEAQRWFTRNVLRLASQNIIQSITQVQSTSVKEGMNNLRSEFGLPLRKRYPKT